MKKNPVLSGFFDQRPRQDSNLRHRLRRAVLYPLSYGGNPQNGAVRAYHTTGRLSLMARVLVVYDTDSIRFLIRTNLEIAGFEVGEAIDEQECPGAAASVRSSRCVRIPVRKICRSSW